MFADVGVSVDPADADAPASTAALASGAQRGPGAPQGLRVIDDRSAPLPERREAARRVLAEHTPESEALLAEILNRPAPDALDVASEPDGQMILLESASQGGPGPLPEWAIGPLVRLAGSGGTERRVLAIGALGGVGTRQGVAMLLSLLPAPDSDPGEARIRDAIFAALVRSTGQLEPGQDQAKWTAWFDATAALSDSEWHRQISLAQSRRADDASIALQRSETRLLGVVVDRFRSMTDADERSAMLSSLIRDDLPRLRELGLELALGELANARPVSAEVAVAATAALQEPSPKLRKAAADLLTILAPASTQDALHRALNRETEPEVAASLLAACARRPSASIREATLHWFQAGEPTASPALGTLAALDEAGLLGDTADRERILTALRLTGFGQLPATGLRLVLSLGTDSDLQRVAQLLAWNDTARKQAAADALASAPRGLGVDVLLQHARTDASIFPQAVRGVRAHRPTAAGFAELAQIRAPSEADLRRALLDLTSVMPPPALVEVAKATPDPRTREAMLATLVSRSTEQTVPESESPSLPGLPGRSAQVDRGGGTPPPEVVQGLLLLCRTRLELRQPAAALQALDVIAPGNGSPMTPEWSSLRTHALLWLGRVDEAAAGSAPLEDWLEGLESSIGQFHAQRIVGTMEKRFGPSSTWAQPAEQRFRAAADRVQSFVGPLPEDGTRQ